jgi:hypothetical protein
MGLGLNWPALGLCCKWWHVCKAKWHKTLPQPNGIFSKSKGQKGVWELVYELPLLQWVWCLYHFQVGEREVEWWSLTKIGECLDVGSTGVATCCPKCHGGGTTKTQHMTTDLTFLQKLRVGLKRFYQCSPVSSLWPQVLSRLLHTLRHRHASINGVQLVVSSISATGSHHASCVICNISANIVANGEGLPYTNYERIACSFRDDHHSTDCIILERKERASYISGVYNWLYHWKLSICVP